MIQSFLYATAELKTIPADTNNLSCILFPSYDVDQADMIFLSKNINFRDTAGLRDFGKQLEKPKENQGENQRESKGKNNWQRKPNILETKQK